MITTVQAAKAAATALRADLAGRGVDLSHSAALEVVAHQLGFADWNTARAVVAARSGLLGSPVPVLRVQRVDDVRPFYVDYLGFTVELEHRFAPDLPLYVRVARDAVRLDLSEHHGDGTPGGVVWVPVADATRLADELVARRWPTSRPAVDADAPGGPTVEVVDPSGNVLRFCQASPVTRGRSGR